MWYAGLTWAYSCFHFTEIHASEAECVRELALYLYYQNFLFSEENGSWLPPSTWVPTLEKAKLRKKKLRSCDLPWEECRDTRVMRDALANYPAWTFELLDCLCTYGGQSNYKYHWAIHIKESPQPQQGTVAKEADKSSDKAIQVEGGSGQPQ